MRTKENSLPWDNPIVIGRWIVRPGVAVRGHQVLNDTTGALAAVLREESEALDLAWRLNSSPFEELNQRAAGRTEDEIFPLGIID